MLGIKRKLFQTAGPACGPKCKTKTSKKSGVELLRKCLLAGIWLKTITRWIRLEPRCCCVVVYLTPLNTFPCIVVFPHYHIAVAPLPGTRRRDTNCDTATASCCNISSSSNGVRTSSSIWMVTHRYNEDVIG